MERPLAALRLENVVGAMSLAMVDKMEQAFAAATGRGPSVVAAITRIGGQPGLSIERLRRVIALSHSAAVRLVDQLVAEGLVRRQASDGPDRRARALYLSDSGDRLLEAAKAARRGVTGAALAGLSENERGVLEAILAKMLPALVGPGDDQDIVCRLCDESVCAADSCPVAHHGAPTA